MIDTTDPHADYPPDQRFVNQGTDERIPGEIGKFLALIQRLESFKSATPPIREVKHLSGGGLYEVATAPNGKQHLSYAFPTGNGRWMTFRFGYRYDANWGDANVKGYNPEPGVIGGYIYDAVLKLRAKQTFIAGYEHG